MYPYRKQMLSSLRSPPTMRSILLLIISLSLAVTGFTQDKFDCDGTGYFSYGNVNSNGTVYIGEYDTSSASTGSNFASTTEFNHNALGFNRADSLLYVVSNPQRKLYQIDASGTHTNLGTISGWNISNNIYAGDFDANGVYVVSGHSNIGKIFRINVYSNPPAVLTTNTLTYSSGSGTPDFADFAYNPIDSLFYGIDRGTGKMHKINASNGVCTAVSNSSSGPYIMGACYFNSDFTRLVGHGRSTSTGTNNRSFSCDISTGVCTLLATSGQNSYGNADGCGCSPYQFVCTDDTTIVDTMICEGDSVVIGDTAIYDTYSNEMVYENQGGCDSLVNIDVVVNTKDSISHVAMFCHGDSIIIGDTVIYDTYSSEETYTNASGCDSTVIIDVIVGTEFWIELDTTICPNDTLFWYGQTIVDSGEYNHTILTGVQCDTFLQLNVSLEPVAVQAQQVNNVVFVNATTGGSFIGWIDCKNNSIVSTSDTLNNPQPGTEYAAVSSSASGNCNDTSDCIELEVVSIGEVALQNIRFYPNPSQYNGVNYSGDEAIEAIKVFGIDGRLIPAEIQNNTTISGEVIFEAAGIYIISVRFENGTTTAHQVIIL